MVQEDPKWTAMLENQGLLQAADVALAGGSAVCGVLEDTGAVCVV
jgi:hypothetical protein